MPDIPQFRVPFQINGSAAAEIEQDTDEDILACVETILRTPTGTRLEHPQFGLDDPAFATQPALIEAEILEAIEEWEPRITAVTKTEIHDRIATTGVTVA